jgi:small subunit ribosomal protein S6
MPLYESTFIAKQDLSKQQVTAIADQFADILKKGGGKVVKNEYWGLRPLAYRIQKHRRGHYVMLGIDAPAPAVHEMERNMGINEDVMRHLTIRVEKIEEEPSAPLRSNREDTVEEPVLDIVQD